MKGGVIINPISSILSIDIVDFSSKTEDCQANIIENLFKILNKAFEEDPKSQDNYAWIPTGTGGSLIFLNETKNILETPIEIGRLIRETNKALIPLNNGFRVRMGLHCGSVLKKKGLDGHCDFWGEAIKIASYIANMAHPDQIVASDDFCKNADLGSIPKLEVNPIGPWCLKGDSIIMLYNIHVNSVGISGTNVGEWYGTFNYPLDIAINMYKSMAQNHENLGAAFRAAVVAKKLLDLNPPQEIQKEAKDIIKHLSKKTQTSPIDERHILYDIFFSKLTPGALVYFFQNSEFSSFNPQDIIFHEDKEADLLMMVVTGEIIPSIKGQRLTKWDRKSDREKDIVLKEGDIIGEMALFNPEHTRTATLVAQTTAITLSLDYSFLRLTKDINESEINNRKDIQGQIWLLYKERTVDKTIQTHPMLRELSLQHRHELLDNSKFMPIDPYDSLQINEKDIWDCFIIIVSGGITVYLNKNSERYIKFKKGDCIGPYRYIHQVKRSPYSKVKAAPNTHIVCFPWKIIEKIINQSDEFRIKCLVKGDEIRRIQERTS